MALTTPDVQSLFRAAHDLLLGLLGDQVTLKLRQADGTFADAGPYKAKVSELRLQDVVAGSTARAGDLRVILLAADLQGQRRLELKDRVLWRGREYGVLQYDDATDSIGSESFAVNVFLRG